MLASCLQETEGNLQASRVLDQIDVSGQLRFPTSKISLQTRWLQTPC